MNNDTIDFLSGWIGGVVGVIGCHPFDTVKCRIQAQGSGNIPLRYKNGWHCFRDTFKTEGMRGLYKGVIPPSLGQGAINAIVFGVDGMTGRHLEPYLKGDGLKKEMKKELAAGAVAGFLQSFVCAPMELVKLRTQHQEVGRASVYQGNWKTLMAIYRSRGLTGCFQGFGVTAFRDTPAFAVYFASYASLMHSTAETKGIKRDELSLWFPFVYGGVAGIASWSINYPVDVIKTRIQMDGADGVERIYRNSWDCFKKTYSEGGVRLLFRGLIPCYVRAFANSAFIFLAVEASKRLLNRF